MAIIVAVGPALCVAADGDVSLEAAHAGPCATDTETHHGTDSVPAHWADHGCVDVQIVVASDAKTRPVPNVAAVAVLEWKLACVACSLDIVCSAERAAQPGSSRDTVVLLI